MHVPNVRLLRKSPLIVEEWPFSNRVRVYSIDRKKVDLSGLGMDELGKHRELGPNILSLDRRSVPKLNSAATGYHSL